MNTDVVVIGAGPAGMMAAITAAENGKQVILLEKNRGAGKKLLLTGNGRCNLTRAVADKELIAGFHENGRFLFRALHIFNSENLIKWFNDNGVPLFIENDYRVFPKSQHSADILKALTDRIKALDIEVFYSSGANSLLIKNNQVYGVQTETEMVYSDSVIVATGGLSWSNTGSDGDGYGFARQALHNIVSLRPGLTGLELSNVNLHILKGLSLKKIKASVQYGNKLIASAQGDLIFTHYGVSGPVVLNLCRFVKSDFLNDCSLRLDLFPDQNLELLGSRLRLSVKKNNKKQLKNVLSLMMADRMADFALVQCKINPRTQVSYLKRDDLCKLIHFIKDWRLLIKKSRPFSEAMITVGGIDLKEINPGTMESRLCTGLFFAGEVLNIDGKTGGYNLQAAFSTGYLAGANA